MEGSTSARGVEGRVPSETTFTTGSVAQVRKQLRRQLGADGRMEERLMVHEVLFDARAGAGASGAPVLNSEARVIGVQQAVAGAGPSPLSVIVPVRYVRELLGSEPRSEAVR